MKKILLGFSLLVFGFSLCEGQSWVWGFEGTQVGRGLCESYSVAADNFGNAFETGWVLDTVLFGSHPVYGYGDNSNVESWKNTSGYLVKLDSLGNIKWLVTPQIPSSNSFADGYEVATDIIGNSYITGVFYDTAAFGLDTIFSGLKGTNIYLAKFSPNGITKWAKSPKIYSATSLNYSEGSFEEGVHVSADRFQNSFITGYFEDTIEFGTYKLISEPYTAEYFVVKYDSSGIVKWALQFNVPSKFSQALVDGICNDDSGNTFLSGTWVDTAKIGNDTLITLTNSQGAFLIKINPLGQSEWYTHSTPKSGYNFVNPFRIHCDREGNILMTGTFKDTLIFDNDTLISSTSDAFIAKFNPNGNIIWVKKGTVLDSHQWIGRGISTDNHENLYVYVGGAGGQDTNFNIVIDKDTFKTIDRYGDGAMLMLKFDSLGGLQCGTIGPGGEDDGAGMGADISGNYVYVGGDMFSSVIFAKDTFNFINNFEAPFVARWQPCNNIESFIPPISNKPSTSLFPNPNTGAFTLEVESEKYKVESVEIYNVMGQKVFSSNYSLSTNHYSLDLSSQPSGVYLYRVIDETGKLLGEGKFVIEK